MLNVLFTVDTEIWCGGWNDLDARFPEAYRRYVYGPTARGDFALPALFRILDDHGLRGVFFVEPLFADRFGEAPLEELVGLVVQAGQEVQAHLHTEWVDEARVPLIAGPMPKRGLLRQFSRDEQTLLVNRALELLRRAGAPDITAFRAGNYALNLDTLHALGANGIDFDSSYNPGSEVGVSDVAPGTLLTQPSTLHGVKEYPVTVYKDGRSEQLRHLQLTACSFKEFTAVLNHASECGWDSVVIVAHNFELLNPAKTRPDPILVRRFRKLCGFLGRNSDRFHVCGFKDLPPRMSADQPAPLRSNLWLTGARLGEQLTRRVIGQIPAPLLP